MPVEFLSFLKELPKYKKPPEPPTPSPWASSGLLQSRLQGNNRKLITRFWMNPFRAGRRRWSPDGVELQTDGN
ncbi:hypothetical protein CEXT_184671 [Caerostris extrusa]|uniref:Uncharacterized protein n=1 Tax=Caerostris extrusa TaxID=172846 RepID=A0AAV4P359_CAEEX|nr:hypothetical protein CEXT_184671 [Caerostris extrusa]